MIKNEINACIDIKFWEAGLFQGQISDKSGRAFSGIFNPPAATQKEGRPADQNVQAATTATK
jgi:hypothetical protein